MSHIGVFVDFGSTYTKVTAFDLNEETIIGQGWAESTVRTDLTIGLKNAYEEVERDAGRPCIESSDIRLACSSAAPGSSNLNALHRFIHHDFSRSL